MPTAVVVDVILPAYNGAAMIRSALESALSQDVPLRVIVVDDGSSDNSADIARSYGPRVHVIVQDNRGVSGARNAALAAATAPFVAFLDQDDVWKPGKLRRQIELMERHPDVGMVFTDMTILESDGKVVEDGFLAATAAYQSLERKSLGAHAYLLSHSVGSAIARFNFISPSTALVRARSLTEINGFDESLRLCDDAECWMRLLNRWRCIAIEDRLVLSYRWGGNASILKWRGLIEERIRIGVKVDAQPELYAPDTAAYFSEERPVSLYRLGVGELRSGDIAAARALFTESISAEWRLTTVLAYVATLLPASVREPLLRAKRLYGLRWPIRVE